MAIENPDHKSDELDDLCMGEWGSGENLSRRDFSSMSVAAVLMATAGMSASMPRVARAAALSLRETDVSIKTPDGTMDAAFIHPASGTHPGVVFWPDAPSLREALRTMGREIAGQGYAVVIPNVFYRTHKAPLTDRPISTDDKEFMGKMQAARSKISVEGTERDAKALVEFLDAQSVVNKSRKIGTTGYCAGGPPAMRTAAIAPDRVGAVGIFHGGGLVTDRPDSPHLLIPKMKARFYVAVAAEDDAKEPTVKDKLRASLAAANLPATIEVYAGTAHSWTISDFPVVNGKVVYNPTEAKRATDHLVSLYKQALA